MYIRWRSPRVWAWRTVEALLAALARDRSLTTSGSAKILPATIAHTCVPAMAGTAGRFDVFSKIEHPTFPGGTMLRHPLLVLAMLWYVLRDKLP